MNFPDVDTASQDHDDSHFEDDILSRNRVGHGGRCLHQLVDNLHEVSDL